MKKKASIVIFSLVVAVTAVALGIGIAGHWPTTTDQNRPGEVGREPQAQTQSPMISQTRPDFTMPDLTGTQRNIKEWDGKVLAVNFWATWCEPCKEEIAGFNTLQKQYGGEGFQFIGVALDDLDAVQTYLKTRTIAYPVLIGEDEAVTVASHYGDDEGVVPYTAFINRKGQIAFIQYGAMSQALARQVIESLL
jgi:thiol-disulfide isomerase/thioredoxin